MYHHRESLDKMLGQWMCSQLWMNLYHPKPQKTDGQHHFVNAYLSSTILKQTMDSYKWAAKILPQGRQAHLRIKATRCWLGKSRNKAPTTAVSQATSLLHPKTSFAFFEKKLMKWWTSLFCFFPFQKGNVKFVAFGAGGEHISCFYVYLCKQYDK